MGNMTPKHDTGGASKSRCLGLTQVVKFPANLSKQKGRPLSVAHSVAGDDGLSWPIFRAVPVVGSIRRCCGVGNFPEHLRKGGGEGKRENRK